MTILVTGASGFIGRHICEGLVESGYKVRGLIRSQHDLENQNIGLQYFTGNILDSDALKEACRGVNVVVHAAGIAHVNNSDIDALQSTNVLGTQLVVEAASNSGVKRLIFISSALASKSSDERDTSTKYAQTKRDAEKIVLSAYESGQLDVVILRPVNVYGPGMRGNIALFISLIKRGVSLPLPESDSKISLVGVRDLSEAVVLSIEASQAAGRTYVVTDGLEYNTSQIENQIYRAAKKEMSSLKVPGLILYMGLLTAEYINKSLSAFNLRLPVIGGLSRRTYRSLFRDWLFDNSAIKQDLGFKPKTTLYDSLEEIIHNMEN